MKKQLFTCFSILLVLTLLLAPTGSAAAAPLADGPSIYSSTDDSVDTTMLEISKLPGTVKLDSGAIYPVGHESGDLIFSGSGLKVTGLTGSAVIHMPVKNFTYGWTGSIYQYAFGGWIEVPTIITKDNESSNGTASATIYYDGIYAVLVHYVAPVVVDKGPSCPAYESMSYYMVNMDSHMVGLVYFLAEGDISDLGLTDGMEVNWSVTSINPGVTFEGNTSGTAPIALLEEGGEVFGFAAILFTGDDYLPIISFAGEGLPYFIITVDTGDCNFSYTANEETFDPGGPY